jgi:hypothetical protein
MTATGFLGRKSFKFREHLVPLVLKGEKNVTWRLFDDKNITTGDEVDLINWNTKEKFGEAVVTAVREKNLGKLEDEDWKGHERFESDEEMYVTYSTYYGEKVGPETPVKIISFRLLVS